MKLATFTFGGVLVTLILAQISIASDSFSSVPGKTRDGSRLMLSSSAVSLDTDGLSRKFSYAIVKKDGSMSVRTASTLWCRHGKIQLDKRIHNVVGSHTIPINTPNAFITPGWWANLPNFEQVYVTVDSSASRNLLAQVCKKKL